VQYWIRGNGNPNPNGESDLVFSGVGREQSERSELK